MMILSGCNTAQKFSENEHITGTYGIFFINDKSMTKDSVWIKIELYDIASGKPLNFDRPKTTLNEHPNKVIKDNYCIAYFQRDEVPKSIFLELHRAGKYPKTFFPKLKKNKQILIKAYLADDKRISI